MNTQGEYEYYEQQQGGLADEIPSSSFLSNDHHNDNMSTTHEVDDDEDEDILVSSGIPKILLMGPRRSGKSSIQRVVFSKMSPHETLFRLEPTHRIEKSVVNHTPLCRFQVWDFPGEYGYDYHHHTNAASGVPGAVSQQHQQHHHHPNSSADKIFQNATALIFVMDAQDEPYDHVLQNLTETVTLAYKVNPHIAIEVFINKVDGELFLSDEAKYDCRRDIMQQVADELAVANLSEVVPIAYYLTSIYDHSIFEALSKVCQKLIPQLPTLENLLNVLVSTCSMEKAFLFDVASKLYICTDSSPVDMQAVELCSDMIDVVLDVSGIYGMKQQNHHNTNRTTTSLGAAANIATANAENAADLEDEDEEAAAVSETEAAAYDNESSSVIRLSNGMVLYLKEVDTMLALVCLIRAENFRKKSLINYNIGCFKKALSVLPTPNMSADHES